MSLQLDSTCNLQLAQSTVFDESDNKNSMGMLSPSKGTYVVKVKYPCDILGSLKSHTSIPFVLSLGKTTGSVYAVLCAFEVITFRCETSYIFLHLPQTFSLI